MSALPPTPAGFAPREALHFVALRGRYRQPGKASQILELWAEDYLRDTVPSRTLGLLALALGQHEGALGQQFPAKAIADFSRFTFRVRERVEPSTVVWRTWG
jgi:hypothetical protein